MEQINNLQSLISVQLSSAMFTTTLAYISHLKSLMSTAASYLSMFLSFIHRNDLPITFVLFISNAKIMQCLCICVNSIPLNRDSPINAFILSRLTQISGRRGRDLFQPGSNKCSSI